MSEAAKKRDRWADSDESADEEAPRASKKTTAEPRREPPDVEVAAAARAAPVEDAAREAPPPAADLATAGSFSHTLSARRRVRQPLCDGCRSVDVFERLDRVEEGSYGVVYRARDLGTGEIVALKRVKLTREACVDGFPITALREINVLLALRHDNIVRVQEMVVGRDHDKVFMVMEYFDHDLKACVAKVDGPFTQAEVKCLATQLLAAVRHMHDHWFIHRDIKTSNLLYSNKGRLSLCDFGLARRYSDPVAPYTRNVVTQWYRCPELLLGTKEYACKVDMWSVGCVIAELLLKKPIFMGKSELEQLSEIFKVLGSPNEERWPGYDQLPFASTFKWKPQKRNRLRDKFPIAGFGSISTTPLTDAGLDLLDRLLALNPKARIDAKGAVDHPYFAESPPPTPRSKMPTFPVTRI